MITDNECIVAVENNDAEYDAVLRKIDNRPTDAPEGYIYRLRADTLEWELYELPPMPPEDEEATTEDYEAALSEVGV